VVLLLITFDLDGTLIDSAEDLANAVNAMLSHFGRRPIASDVIQTYVGNGAGVLVRRALGDQTSSDIYEQALAFFLDYYRQHSLENTRLYPGLKSLIEDLQSMDHQLAVLTNKPVAISEDILNGLKMGKYFFRIYGGDSFSTKKPDPVGMLTILSEAGAQPREALLIGDSPVDVQTAHNSGVRCCGVLWGFQPHMLQAAGADMLISKPHQLMAYI
jgi:phosphoglycolate phosphatase